MPRETILPERDDEFQVEVKWGAHEVQVGIETPPDPATGLRHHLVDHLYGQGDGPAQIGRALIYGTDVPGEFDVLYHRVKDAPDSESETDALATLGRHVLDAVTGSNLGYTGLWTTIPRPGLNRLVKVVRRARDVIHGADE